MILARAVTVSLGSLILAASFHLAPGPAGAASKDDVDQPPDFGLEPREQDVAVIIGIEKYRDIEAPSEFSADDAALVKVYAKSLGFRESNIRLIVNDRATRSDFAKNIERWLPDNAKPNGKVFFYFSGHGSPDLSDPANPRAFLLPYDGDPNDLQNTGYSISELYSRLGKLKAAEVIVVLDSCFSGQGGRSVLARGARPLINNMMPVGAIAGRMAILTATQPNQISTSAPDKKHGILTYHFLKALRGGTSDMAAIYKKIKPEVEDEAHSLGVKQSPGLMLGESGAVGGFSLASGLDLALAKRKKEAADKALQARKEEEAKRLAEQKRIAEEAKRLEEEKKRLAEAQAEGDRKHKEELERMQREKDEAAKRIAEAQAEETRKHKEELERMQRESDKAAAEQRRQFEAEKKRLEKQRKSAPREEPAFVPPTF